MRVVKVEDIIIPSPATEDDCTTCNYEVINPFAAEFDYDPCTFSCQKTVQEREVCLYTDGSLRRLGAIREVTSLT